MNVAEKTYLMPGSVKEAVSFANKNEKSFRYLAGGTDVIVNKFQGNDEVDHLIDISGIAELKQVVVEGDFLKIGSLVKLDDLKNYPEIKNKFPVLLEAAHAVASPMLRKTATIGGNILCENRCVFYNQSEWWREAVGYCLKCEGDVCIATGGKKNCFSKFVSDLAPVLIALNSFLEITDAAGDYTIRLEDIYTGNGLQPKDLAKTAIIRNIQIPVTEKYVCIFRKLRPREAVDFTSLTTVVSLNDHGKIRIVLGGVDPKPIVVEGIIGSNVEELIDQAVKKPRIVANDFYSRLYRKEMISVFLKGAFEELEQLSIK
jgi:4-hydroxybenzoyl-CoA reductase subunit beta